MTPGVKVDGPGSDGADQHSRLRLHPYPFETRLKTTSDGLRVYRDDFSDPGSGWPTRGPFSYGGGACHILKAAPYGSADLLPWAAAPPGPVRLTVECRGDEIRGLVSDKVAGVAHDLALNSGMVGLLVSGQGHAEFRDLVVEDLPLR